MNITKKAEKVLRDAFCRDGKLIASGVHTCNGTMPLWGQLVCAGYVLPMPSILGHPFNYELTDAGRKYLEP